MFNNFKNILSLFSEYNPCAHKNGGCDQLCKPVNEMPVCDCMEDFVLLQNGFTCESTYDIFLFFSFLLSLCLTFNFKYCFFVFCCSLSIQNA